MFTAHKNIKLKDQEKKNEDENKLKLSAFIRRSGNTFLKDRLKKQNVVSVLTSRGVSSGSDGFSVRCKCDTVNNTWTEGNQEDQLGHIILI